MVLPLLRTTWQYLSKGKGRDTIDSTVKFLRIYPTAMHMCAQKNIYMCLLMETTYHSKDEKQLKYSPI